MIARNLIGIGFGSLIVLVGTATAQESATGSSASSEDQKVVHVCSLNSTEANQEFQRNVRLMQLQRQNVVELKTRMDSASEDEERDRLTKELEAAIAKLNENNKIMLKTYGFSLTRNYTQVIEKSHVYMLLSGDEAAKFAAGNKKSDGTDAGQ